MQVKSRMRALDVPGNEPLSEIKEVSNTNACKPSIGLQALIFA
jgi:hypothetical protein